MQKQDDSQRSSGGLAQFARLASDPGVDAVVDQIMGAPEYRENYGEQGVPGRTEGYCGAPIGTTGR